MKPIELREADFRKAIENNIAYPPAMRLEFFNYWTEPNKSRTRMKWELEKTWHLGRRLARWANNDFGKGKVEVKTQVKVEAENEFTEINRELLAYKARPTNFRIDDFKVWYKFLKDKSMLKELSEQEKEAIKEAYPCELGKWRAAWVMKTFDWYGAHGYLFSDQIKVKI